jgi:hypothetical protein
MIHDPKPIFEKKNPKFKKLDIQLKNRLSKIIISQGPFHPSISEESEHALYRLIQHRDTTDIKIFESQKC